MKKIITISREFGSGGRSIGKAVAQKLNHQYYDKEIIEKIAEETGLSKQFIEQNGEYARGKNVFIHANMEFKKDRIVNLYGEGREKPEKRLEEKHRKRSVNYKYDTDKEWGLAKNYHLTLDSSEFGLERCVEIICSLTLKKKE